MKPNLKIATITPNSKKRLEDRVTRLERWVKHHTAGIIIILLAVMSLLWIYREPIIRVMSAN